MAEQSSSTVTARYLSVAQEIGEQLLREADILDDGSITWHRGRGIHQQPRDAGVINGRVGEALFFSALYAATQRAVFRDIAVRVVAPLREALRGPAYTRRLASEIGIGLAGIGSLIYAFVRMSAFAEDSSLASDAILLSHGVSDEFVEREMN